MEGVSILRGAINFAKPQIKDAKDASQPEGFKFSWTGDRVPARVTIADPSDKEGIRMLFNEEVGYMRDGMVMSPDGRILGTYARTVDYQEQKDGSRLNEIIFRPVSQEELGSNLRNRLKP
jgi:hypothetical protein